MKETHFVLAEIDEKTEEKLATITFTQSDGFATVHVGGRFLVSTNRLDSAIKCMKDAINKIKAFDPSI
jgi:hypothetical protein